MGNYLSGQLLHTIREECKPSATTKPIAETYLEGSSTSHQNGSTEVLQKERSGLCKTTGKSLFRFRHSERSEESLFRPVPGLSNPYSLQWATTTSNFSTGQTYVGAPQNASNCSGHGISGQTAGSGGIQTVTLPNGETYQFQYDA